MAPMSEADRGGGTPSARAPYVAVVGPSEPDQPTYELAVAVGAALARAGAAPTATASS